MAKKSALPFKGTFEHSQGFGARPEVYAKYGLMGHDGDDWKMPEGTPLYSPLTGIVKYTGNDSGGWGKFVQVFDYTQNLLINITHLSRIDVFDVQGVKAGQQIGLSGSTGFSEAPHVHVAAADTDASGFRINTNNGYKGWYSVLDPNKIEIIALPSVTPTPPPSTTPETSSWPDIFAKYYAGWEETAAKADFNVTMKGDINLLLAARGITPGASPTPPQPRPDELKKKYFLIPALAGLSLNQIHNSGISLGRVDLLSGFLRLSPSTPLTAGQELDLTDFPSAYFPNSSEWVGFQKLVGLIKIGNAGDWFIKPEFAGMTLFDIRGKTNLAFRTDILAGFLGISDKVPILGYQGFGTQGFPNFNDAGSGEVQGFKQIFTQTPPEQPKPPEELPASAPAVPLESTISVNSSPPRGKFYIDGLYFKDLTPSNRAYPVIAGAHIVRVEKSGYKPREVSVVVAENEQKVVGLDLEPETSEAQLPTAPVVGVKPTLATLDTRLRRVETTLTAAGILK